MCLFLLSVFSGQGVASDHNILLKLNLSLFPYKRLKVKKVKLFWYRYNQFRGSRPRICYNCRKTGHEARNCDRPNPRMDALKEAKTLSVGVVEEEEEILLFSISFSLK